MKPLKVRDLLSSFAMEMDRPVSEVTAVSNFYFKMLRQKLIALDAKAVSAVNLGTFYIKERALEADMKKYTEMLSRIDQSTIRGYEITKDFKERLFKMNRVKSLLNEERLRRKEIINKRFGNVSEKESDRDLEEQKPDLGRN